MIDKADLRFHNTPYRYMVKPMLDPKTQKAVISRLNRVEGQIRGIARMVEGPEYCIDIINQVNAARRGLEKAALMLVQQHMRTCMSQAIRKKGREAKIREFIRTLDQFIR